MKCYTSVLNIYHEFQSLNLTIKNREGKICWIRVYSLPRDKSRAETSVCHDYPGKEGLKDIDFDVEFLKKIAFSRYGIQSVIMVLISGILIFVHITFDI